MTGIYLTISLKYQISHKSFQWEPSCSKRTVEHRHDKDNSRFLQFSNATEKWIFSNTHTCGDNLTKNQKHKPVRWQIKADWDTPPLLHFVSCRYFQRTCKFKMSRRRTISVLSSAHFWPQKSAKENESERSRSKPQIEIMSLYCTQKESQKQVVTWENGRPLIRYSGRPKRTNFLHYFSSKINQMHQCLKFILLE